MRTSKKFIVLAIIFLALGLICMAVADIRPNRIPKISFSGGSGREWNYWDFAAVGGFVLFASFSAVSLMLASKEE
jgi:hypothetical protein